jgi:D-glycero-alpha-D-manno-heptose-7-phosphate kinase
VILARAPLRLTFGGGGTDVPSYYGAHGGFVVSGAIDKYVYIYVNRPAADDLIRVSYSTYEEVDDLQLVRHDLVRPALQLVGIDRNVEITSMADVPAGTGLGSSSTYLVALLAALHALKRQSVSTEALAEMACHVEMDLAQHPVGKQDHYLAALGGLTCLEISRDGTVQATPLKVSRSVVEDLRSRLLVFFTGVRRSALEILEAQKSNALAQKPGVLDSLHKTKEIGYRVREALEAGDLDRFGQLLHEHWEHKKLRSNLVTSERIDRWYDLARSTGAVGGKLVGAGGGGFLMFYAPLSRREPVRRAMKSASLRELTYDFDSDGVKVLVNI